MDAPSAASNSSAGNTQPEKYIRTLAGDIDAVKKGAAPDLAPLGAPSVPATPPAPLSPISESLPPPVTVPAPPTNLPLQTYANDFRERVKQTNASTVTILAAEQDTGQQPARVVLDEPLPRAHLSYLIAGAVLLLVSIGGAVAAYIHFRTTSAPVVSMRSIPAPIFVDEQEEVAGNGTALLQAIVDSTHRLLNSGTVRLLSIATTTSAEPAFSLIAPLAPDALLRNIHIQGSMVGVLNVGGTQSPFFILSISSYSSVFSALLTWEPLMPGHLAELFPPYLTPPPVSGITPSALQVFGGASASSTQAATSTMGSSTPKSVAKTGATAASKSAPKIASTTPLVLAAGFYDVTIANHDARTYRDSAGRDVLVYGFWDQSTLVIARDAAAFSEILTRLGTARTQPQ